MDMRKGIFHYPFPAFISSPDDINANAAMLDSHIGNSWSPDI